MIDANITDSNKLDPTAHVSSRAHPRFMVSYQSEDKEVQTLIEQWLASQKNKSKSICFLIHQYVMEYGTRDVLSEALGKTQLYKDESSHTTSQAGDSYDQE